jgi:hypothetical protein
MPDGFEDGKESFLGDILSVFSVSQHVPCQVEYFPFPKPDNPVERLFVSFEKSSNRLLGFRH